MEVRPDPDPNPAPSAPSEPRVTDTDLVLEGGGVKGLALVGAIQILADAGYSFRRIAGTSAGAMVASILAGMNRAGESYDRLEDIARTVDYRKFSDRTGWLRPLDSVWLTPVANALAVLTNDGMYEGRYLLDWLTGVLADLGVRSFGDLRLPADPGSDLPGERRFGLVVIASDVSRQRMVRLPWDYADYGLDPDDQPVALAVRASASIPFFFEPVTMKLGPGRGAGTLVDGGVLSNFPITIFDREDGVSPRWPTFGIRTSAKEPKTRREEPVKGPLALGLSMVETMTAAHDAVQMDEPINQIRTMFADTSAVSPFDFDLGPAEQALLLESGHVAAEKFLSSWDFREYVDKCRGLPDG